MIKKHIFYLSLFSFIFILFSCNNDDSSEQIDPIQIENDYLIDVKLINTLNKEQIQAVGNFLFSSQTQFEAQYGVEGYKIEYRTTDVDGNEITASGALILPKTTQSIPLLSYQHGTLTNNSDAPSFFNTSSNLTGVTAAISSTGYAVVLPDYIGYGSSSSLLHPYEHKESLATASLDLLKAVKEFLKAEEKQLNDQLFLAGYSEGGFATMALHQKIEETTNWTVTMSAPASGAYNKTAFSLEVIQRNENLNFLPFYLWVVNSYNWIYDLDRDWNQIVNDPYDKRLSQVENPMNIPSTELNNNPQNLFLPSFRNGIENKSDISFKNALADNDCFDWTPKYPITLYYGTDDRFVFPLNTVTAGASIQKNGGDIKVVSYEGENHQSTFFLYLNDVFQLFDGIKK